MTPKILTCHFAAVVVLTLALNACAAMQPTACKAGEQAAIHDTLYFGTGIPDRGVVTPDEWSMFLANEVTARFPQVLTVSQASGQWRSEDGSIVLEPSYVLQLVHPGSVIEKQSIEEIIATYKAMFGQEAVLRVKTHASVSI